MSLQILVAKDETEVCLPHVGDQDAEGVAELDRMAGRVYRVPKSLVGTLLGRRLLGQPLDALVDFTQERWGRDHLPDC